MDEPPQFRGAVECSQPRCRQAGFVRPAEKIAAVGEQPAVQVFKTKQEHFKVKLPRRVKGVTPPAPTWPPAGAAKAVIRRKR